jgi:hypothetical protein
MQNYTSEIVHLFLVYLLSKPPTEFVGGSWQIWELPGRLADDNLRSAKLHISRNAVIKGQSGFPTQHAFTLGILGLLGKVDVLENRLLRTFFVFRCYCEKNSSDLFFISGMTIFARWVEVSDEFGKRSVIVLTLVYQVSIRRTYSVMG